MRKSMTKDISEVSSLLDLCKDFLNHHPDCLYLVLDIVYYDYVSCTHSAPKDKPTNWYGKNNLPTGYPGFKGRVWWGYVNGKNDYRWKDLSQFCIHTGTGGYGLYGLEQYAWHGIPKQVFHEHLMTDRKRSKSFLYPLSTDVKIFVDDFPTIYLKLKHQLMMLILAKPKEPQTQRVQVSVINKKLFQLTNQFSNSSDPIEEVDIDVETITYQSNPKW